MRCFVLTVLLGAFVSTFVAGCGTSYLPVSPNRTLLDQAHGEDAIRGAIVRALARRGYRTEGESRGEIQARFQRGLWFRVAIQYDAREFSIHYQGSDGLSERRDDVTGELELEASYDHWIRGLARTIEQELDDPNGARRRDAQLAARRARRARWGISSGGASPAPSQGIDCQVAVVGGDGWGQGAAGCSNGLQIQGGVGGYKE